MLDNYTEMVHILENVAKVNMAVTLPFIQKKTGLQVVSHGADHGMIVTEADLNVSKSLLGPLRENYPGSFSEEDDSAQRLKSTEIYQVDPIDGTGDFVDTYQSSKVTGPTTLVSRLKRKSLTDKFVPVAGLIFDAVHEIALVSDGTEVGLYKVRADGKIEEVKFEGTEPKKGDKVKINRRVSYPQLTFDGPFMDYLKAQGINVQRVNVGGAGIFALQVFRNYIQPKQSVPGFSDLEALTIGFNAQPDWKTWDTDPTEVIANALGLPKRTDIYGCLLTANAANEKLSDMHHKTGYILSTSAQLRGEVVRLAGKFQERNPDCSLLKKDYDYKNAIVAL